MLDGDRYARPKLRTWWDLIQGTLIDTSKSDNQPFLNKLKAGKATDVADVEFDRHIVGFK